MAINFPSIDESPWTNPETGKSYEWQDPPGCWVLVKDGIKTLENTIINIEEDLEVIAPSHIRGIYNFTSNVNPSEGEFSCNSSVFSEITTVTIHPIDANGIQHQSFRVELGDHLEIFNLDNPYGMKSVVTNILENSSNYIKVDVLVENFLSDPQEVDDQISEKVQIKCLETLENKVDKKGDTMTGRLTLPDSMLGGGLLQSYGGKTFQWESNPGLTQKLQAQTSSPKPPGNGVHVLESGAIVVTCGTDGQTTWKNTFVSLDDGVTWNLWHTSSGIKDSKTSVVSGNTIITPINGDAQWADVTQISDPPSYSDWTRNATISPGANNVFCGTNYENKPILTTNSTNTNKEIWKTEDKGKTWSKTGAKLPDLNNLRFAEYSSTSDVIIFGGGGDRFLIAQDWNNLSNYESKRPFNIGDSGGFGYKGAAMGVTSDGIEVFTSWYKPDFRFVYTLDRGETWHMGEDFSDYGTPHGDPYNFSNVHYDPTHKLWIVCFRKGIGYSKDGINWERLGKPPGAGNSELVCANFMPNGQVLTIDENHRAWQTTTEGYFEPLWEGDPILLQQKLKDITDSADNFDNFKAIIGLL